MTEPNDLDAEWKKHCHYLEEKNRQLISELREARQESELLDQTVNNQADTICQLQEQLHEALVGRDLK